MNNINIINDINIIKSLYNFLKNKNIQLKFNYSIMLDFSTLDIDVIQFLYDHLDFLYKILEYNTHLKCLCIDFEKINKNLNNLNLSDQILNIIVHKSLIILLESCYQTANILTYYNI